MRLFERKTIYGCEARGDGDSAYLTRFTIISGRLGQICIHKFHRSDADDLHDHPWPFVTIPLWRGYIEQTEGGKLRFIWPLSVNYRPAEHRHRVILSGGKPAWTLVVMGKRVRAWGFTTPKGWVFWRTYFEEKGC